MRSNKKAIRRTTRKRLNTRQRKNTRRRNTRRRNTRRRNTRRINTRRRLNTRQRKNKMKGGDLRDLSKKIITKVVPFAGSTMNNDKVIEFIREQYYSNNDDHIIGKGGSGKVYKYTDGNKTDDNKCVKVSMVDGFLREHQDNEIKIMKKIMKKSPFKVKMVKLFHHLYEPHKSDPDGDLSLCFIIMERIHGFSILDVINFTTTPLKDRVDIAVSLFDSLQMLHSIGISHNDLTTSNIIVSPVNGKNISVIIDFGEARFIEENGKFDTTLNRPMGNSGDYAIGSSNDYPGDLYSFCLIMLILFLTNNADRNCVKIIQPLIHLNEEDITQKLQQMNLVWVDENAQPIITKLISKICSKDLSITLDELNTFMVETLEPILTGLNRLVS
jgi:serine/threonine protein kinase